MYEVREQEGPIGAEIQFHGLTHDFFTRGPRTRQERLTSQRSGASVIIEQIKAMMCVALRK